MALPKKEKNYLPLIPTKVGVERRQEMLDDITDYGTFLPKGVLHADLDKGILDFVKDDLKLTVDGVIVPTVNKIITTQSWSQFTETWDFQDLDKNVSLPFIITVRQPEVKYGKFQGGIANIPNRREFFYYTVPTWDGQRKGANVYKIPQPVPVDITYNIKIFCNRMRELNEFNKIMMQKFTSKQAYTQIKGHYMPITLEDPVDESAKEIEKRKYYVQSYKITLNGLLIDEDEFQISPAITRQVSLFEFESGRKSKRVKIEPPNPNTFDLDLTFVSGNTELSEVFRYDANIIVTGTENVISCFSLDYSSSTINTLNYTNCSGNSVTVSTTVGNSGSICSKSGTVPYFTNVTGGTLTDTTSCANGYSVFINNNYVGDNVGVIQISSGDTLKVVVYKDNPSLQSIIKTEVVLV